MRINENNYVDKAEEAIKSLVEESKQKCRGKVNIVTTSKIRNLLAFVKQAEILEILKEIRQSKKNYLLFSKYMEALIAFHKYYGGKEQ